MVAKKSVKISEAKKPKNKKIKNESESDDEVEEITKEMAELATKPKKKTKKIVELAPESVDEKEEIFHECAECGVEFNCFTGKFSKDGKRYKCSCAKERDPDSGENFYFCSEDCLVGGSEEDNIDEENESEGYETA